MKKYHAIISAFFLVAFYSNALADWPIYFVRITCIPEADYFSFNSATIYEDRVLNGVKNWNNENNVNKRMKIWEQAGYYRPTNLKYECHLPTATYTLIANQDPAGGHCNSPGKIYLNLLRDNAEIISGVQFGTSAEPFCPSGTTLEGAMASGNTLHTLRISKNINSASKSKWLLSSKETETVITPAVLTKYANEDP